MARSYDRVAHVYDETRGGIQRGRDYAREIDPLLADGTVIEIGIGTGLVAAALGELGRRVVGFDIGALMLERAVARLGPRVALADATCTRSPTHRSEACTPCGCSTPLTAAPLCVRPLA